MKHQQGLLKKERRQVSPLGEEGSGLKHIEDILELVAEICFSSRRGGEWIETNQAKQTQKRITVSPLGEEGSGLKPMIYPFEI